VIMRKSATKKTARKSTKTAVAKKTARKKSRVKAIPWKSMTLGLLKKLAGLVGIGGRSKMSREQLVRVLQKETRADGKTRKLVAKAVKSKAGPSSVARPKAKPAAPPPPPPAPFMDRGQPIPETYGRDVLRLMARDPEWVFVYWELTPDSLNELRNQYADLHTKHWHIRLVDVRGGHTILNPVFLGACSWYLHVEPRRAYKAELGFPHGDGFVTVLTSNTARTPASAISERTDEEWLVLRRDLMRIVHLQSEQDLFGPKRPHTSGERFKEITEEQLQLLRRQAKKARKAGASGGVSSPGRGRRKS